MLKKITQLTLISLTLILMLFINDLTLKNYNHKIVKSVNNTINITEIKNELQVDKIQELQNYYDNKEIKAIITIDGLNNFNYPVVQTINNDYYLNHNYYKEYDAYGSIYADYRVDLDNSQKKIIFGHSSTKKEVPFNELEKYYDIEFYNDHKYITLETNTNTYRYEIFSVYVETNNFTYMNMLYNTKEEWYYHLKELQSKSLYQTNINLNQDDEILILQTCSNNSNYSKYSKKYLLIVSRRVK